ncbi:MAG TPA: CapA family protein [Opitutaceae bacterium]
MTPADEYLLRLCLTGDVMTGRGVDQILPHPGDPALHERYVRDARDYVRLAEAENGPIPAPVDPAYIWGDALPTLRSADARIVNLETSITRHDRPWPGKGIHYRMHPSNTSCLSAAGLSCCSLANNHVLDWGRPGLLETLDSLDRAGLAHAGAGRNAAEASALRVLDAPGKGRVLVLAAGSETSGIPPAWQANAAEAGVHLLDDLSPATAARLARSVLSVSEPDDVTVISIHWGNNWGYEIPREQIDFAHRLADEGVDIVHGHSSHHPKAIEWRRQCLILYGCGDFVTDYEGIGGHEAYRPALSIAHLVRVQMQPRRLVRVELAPFRLRRMRLEPAPESDARWLAGRLDRESTRFGTRVTLQSDGMLRVQPQ